MSMTPRRVATAKDSTEPVCTTCNGCGRAWFCPSCGTVYAEYTNGCPWCYRMFEEKRVSVRNVPCPCQSERGGGKVTPIGAKP